MAATERLARVIAAALIALVAWWLPDARRDFIQAVVKVDAPPGAPPSLPTPPDGAAGLPPADVVRVVLIDGVNADDVARMPAWDGLCARGLDLRVDVGFPTVSLPVQVSLWTGLTQQQTGVLFHSGFPLADPLGPRAIPGQVPGSVAVAETHPYIVHSLGFEVTRPPLGDGKALPPGWDVDWLGEARAAIAGPAPLAFVHVVRVDTAGHKHGRTSAAWDDALAGADAALADLIAAGDAAHPGARWFVLADHGHLPRGGHGHEDRAIRIVRACVVGDGIAPATPAGTIALVDLSRALADSVGATLPAAARGRPLHGALAAPLAGDELVPAIPAGRWVVAGLLLLAGVIATAWALGRRAAAWGPWWWPAALLLVVVQLGGPHLAMTPVFAPKGDAIADAARWAIYGAAAWTAAGVLLAGRPGWRVAVALVALPLAGVLAALALCGGLPVLWGDVVAPIAPRWTAWASVAIVVTSRGLWAVALALLATAVLPSSGPAARWGTRRSGS